MRSIVNWDNSLCNYLRLLDMMTETCRKLIRKKLSFLKQNNWFVLISVI